MLAGGKRGRSAALTTASDSDDEEVQAVHTRTSASSQPIASPVRSSSKRAARGASPVLKQAEPVKPVEASAFFGEAAATTGPAPTATAAVAKASATPVPEVALASDSNASDSDQDIVLAGAASKVSQHEVKPLHNAMPEMEFDGFIVPSAKKLCFQGMSYAITGVFPQLAREDLQQVILTYGGKLATSVSSRTDFLLIGDKLENGDEVSASSKFRAAREHSVPTMDLPAFLSLMKQLPAQGEIGNAFRCHFAAQSLVLQSLKYQARRRVLLENLPLSPVAQLHLQLLHPPQPRCPLAARALGCRWYTEQAAHPARKTPPQQCGWTSTSPPAWMTWLGTRL